MSINNSRQLENDQLANQFEFSIVGGIPGGSEKVSMRDITLRMDKSFEPPKEDVNVVDVWFRGSKVPKTTNVEATDKTFSVSVRVDENWKIYNALKKWKMKVYDPNKANSLGNMSTCTDTCVNVFNHKGDKVKTFKFINSKLKAIQVETFEHSSDEPTRITLDFIYQKMEDGIESF